MTQHNIKPIDGTATGTDLRLNLDSFEDAQNTSHAGASRPTYAQPGMVWVKEVSGTVWQAMLYDGTDDVVVATINPSTQELTLAGDAIADGSIPTEAMASQNVSQWTNDQGYARESQENTFTTRQIIDMGADNSIGALRLQYTETAGETSRWLEIKPPADISVGGNPWRVNTVDAVTLQIDENDAVRIDGSGNIEIVNDLDVLGDLTVDGNPLGDAFSDELFHVSGERTSGIDGGTFTSGAWRTRDLNILKVNLIDGASLSADRITLPAGAYFVIATAFAHKVGGHKTRLSNITDGGSVRGSSEYASTSVANATRSTVTGRFTIAASKQFELQHFCTSTQATDGLGRAIGTGSNEIYSEVLIWKVG